MKNTPSSQENALKKHHVLITDDQGGQRIDNFLFRYCPGVPKGHIYRLIRSGEVRVDGKRIKQTRKLIAGEKVLVPAMTTKVQNQARVPDKLLQLVEPAVLYENQDLLIINKPVGVAVHAGSGLLFGLIDAVRQSRENPQFELAHRLDRATSGCLLMGKGRGVTRKLQELFRQRRVEKRYLALVDGRWPKSITRVDVPMVKNREHAGERRVMVDAAGQHAITYMQVCTEYPQATLLNVSLDTGRTHQIRVHTQHMGHPIVGDTRYGDNSTNTSYRRMGLAGMYLHASELVFSWEGETVKVSAPVDERWDIADTVLTKGQ